MKNVKFQPSLCPEEAEDEAGEGSRYFLLRNARRSFLARSILAVRIRVLKTLFLKSSF